MPIVEMVPKGGGRIGCNVVLQGRPKRLWSWHAYDTPNNMYVCPDTLSFNDNLN